MAAEHLLLVDDSEAILRFEQAVLGGRYRLSLATHGLEALARLSQFKPDLVLLDLSMPKMDGDEVLMALKADPELKSIPVIIISSEEERARKCLALGAEAYLAKPLRADRLLKAVEEALQRASQRQLDKSVAMLPVRVGTLRFGVPLASLVGVFEVPETQPLPGGPHYLRSYFELRGAPVLVLDLARRFNERHTATLIERKLVVVRQGTQMIALCVDEVLTPDAFPEEQVSTRGQLGGALHGLLPELLHSMVRTPQGSIPVLHPSALLSPTLLVELGRALVGVGPRP